MLGTLKPGQVAKTLHSSDYDFNDDMVGTGGYFWVKIIEDRLNVKLIDHWTQNESVILVDSNETQNWLMIIKKDLERTKMILYYNLLNDELM